MLLIAAFLLIASTSAYAAKLPHYVFVLPSGYTGWIQVVFEDPNGAPFEVEHNNAVLKVDDSGIIRLRGYQQTFVGSHDEFFYDVIDQQAKHSRVPVPANFVCVNADPQYPYHIDVPEDDPTPGRIK